ncbi:MAG TPA: hypothetical protein VD838_10045, partial [Anaeromyxobacteraceae bacterium]|nr:hypothetical protein [Anaeromyxobacteraceae bacterium]
MRTRSHTPARTASVAVALLAVLACACGRCRPGAQAGPERFVPADAPAVVIVPELRRLAREAAAVHRAATAFPGLAEVGALREAIRAQLGLDPLDPDALEANGIDADRGAAIAWLLPGPGAADPAGTQLLVLPVAD